MLVYIPSCSSHSSFLVVKLQDEDDDIVAGPQKMSLKCPVRELKHDLYRAYTHAVELCPNQNAMPLIAMRASSMFRCNFVVFCDGTDDHMALSRLREGFEPRRFNHGWV